jgi:hypothetical protein
MKKIPQNTFDFNAASAHELDEHIMESLVFDRPAATPVVTAHLLIEQILETLLARKLKDFDSIADHHRLSFDLKVDLASSLGLIGPKHRSAFKALNGIRNNLAHRHGFRLEMPSLNSLKFDWVPIQNKAFEVACQKGIDEAARIAVIFLCWKAQVLIQEKT